MWQLQRAGDSCLAERSTLEGLVPLPQRYRSAYMSSVVDKGALYSVYRAYCCGISLFTGILGHHGC